MSVADLYDLEFIWPSLDPTDVIVTGTFDQWSRSIYLVKGDAGFVGTVKAPWGQKVAYKFIVDGQWRYRDDQPREDDGDGNMNNVLQTPGKPPVHDPPTRLSIPLDRTASEGYGEAENMVTAIEFLPPAEPAAIRGSLPLPIPQITIECISQAPSPVNESKLNTAAATEGNISPASMTQPAEDTSSKQAPTSYVSILPLNDDGFVPPPSINGNGEASDGDLATHAPIQFTKGGAPTSPSVPETAEVVATPLESAAPQPSRSPEVAQINVSPAAVSEFPVKQPEADTPKTAEQSRSRPAPLPASNVQASSPSTPASSTLTPKKRQSFFARIKHIFDKNKDKQERREKDKH